MFERGKDHRKSKSFMDNNNPFQLNQQNQYQFNLKNDEENTLNYYSNLIVKYINKSIENPEKMKSFLKNYNSNIRN